MQQEINPQSVLQDKTEKGMHMLKSFPKKFGSKSTLYLILGSIAVVLLGVATGWFFSGVSLGQSGKTGAVVSEGEKEPGELGEITNGDKLNEAEGILKVGGIKGEGNYNLERPGGASQTVYLTSTTIDLQPMVDKKVHVWGETLSAVNAPWLMDVVKVKVVE
ncbi:hypothetical protein A3A75_01340 [Candidatus Woesebacteria bacterium RIFCSPLOWO2_01_FULL_39_10]|uniref:Uncharacterized protein n=1 Tax=Candidatus Woesebacteria bacterium RIFCSPLOWO2_01_FULL_39_10 TaxID=1802516 RepID=A0A1F8B7X5_9BACT|nr:MAG: hypothetical protein A3A75_01340 [Candidatus Woesebacteria bacterium RIFCSPLOWO2_01_FULL_39_10]